jgi:hypothetical protein
LSLGLTEFLVGQNAPNPSNLPEAIANLEDASTLFLRRWQRGDFNRAGEVSKRAMELLDFISNEFLRAKVKRKGSNTYSGSQFEGTMSILCATGVTNVTEQEHLDVVLVGAGNGALPASGIHIQINLDRLLNKIKHRKPQIANFRSDNGRHIFVICPDKTEGGAEGIYEFDVETFCLLCSNAAGTL